MKYEAVSDEREDVMEAFLDRYESGYITWDSCKKAIKSLGVRGVQLNLLKLERDQNRLVDYFDDRVDLLQDRFEERQIDLSTFRQELSKVIKDPELLHIRIAESLLRREPKKPEEIPKQRKKAQKYKPFSVMIEEQRRRVMQLRKGVDITRGRGRNKYVL